MTSSISARSTKLVVQAIVAGVVVYLMPPSHLTGFVVLDALVALVWMVGITNAFNLLDNIDGLSAGIAAVAGIFLLAALSPSGSTPLSLAVAAFVGAALGFLVYNVRPGDDFHGGWREPVPGIVSRERGAPRRARAQGRPRPRRGDSPLHPADSDLRHGVCQRDAASRGPQPPPRRTRPSVAPPRGARHRRTACRAGALHARRARRRHRAQPAARRLRLRGHPRSRSTSSCSPASGSCSATSRRTSTHTEGADSERAPQPLVSEVAYQNRWYEVLLDLALDFSRLLRGVPIPFPGRGIRALHDLLRGVVPAGARVSDGGTRHRRQVPAGLAQSFGSPELIGIIKGVWMGVASSALVILYLPYRFEGFSRLVFAIDAVVLVLPFWSARAWRSPRRTSTCGGGAASDVRS